MTQDTSLKLAGIHHVSAISAHIGRSHHFYTRVLGLRPVIRTVNQDEPSMYHLFFGDGVGSPGSDMTVFDIRGAAREHRGNNSITRTNFRVAGDDTLGWWSSLDEQARARSGLAGREPHWELLTMAWTSRARLAVAPAHDVLGLGTTARINHPGRLGGNWSWRADRRAFTPALARRLREITRRAGRLA